LAEFDKGAGFGVKTMVASAQPYAVFTHRHEHMESKFNNGKPVLTSLASVYAIEPDGSTTDKGTVRFFQAVLVGLRQGKWSVGVVLAPNKDAGRNYYDFPWPQDGSWEEAITKAMASVPDVPELEPEPFPIEQDAASTTTDDDPFDK
jgi:hypothetical protein